MSKLGVTDVGYSHGFTSMDLQISIDPGSRTPLHRQIYEEFRRLILSGEWSPGRRVPSSRELADLLKISRTTATSAYGQLLSEGYLESVAGSGTYVSNELPERLLYTGQLTHEEQMPENNRQSDCLSRFGRYLSGQASFETEGRLMVAGSVAFDEVPIKKWRKLLMKHSENLSTGTLEYSNDSRGFKPLREALVDYLKRSRGVKCTVDQVLIVNGSQQALDLVSRVHLDDNDGVIIEDPCYFGAHRTFAAYGAQLYAVPVDEHGLEVERLDNFHRSPVRLIYLTPSHQFPTGAVLPLSRRLKLLEWAREHNALIVEDDYDSEFRYGGLPIPALQGLDRHGVTVYTGTFSKLIFPSLRLGYLVVPEPLVHTYSWAKRLSDHHSPLIEQLALADFITDGSLDHHIRRMRTFYDRKRQKLIHAINKHLGERACVIGDNAGMHLTVKFNLPSSPDHLTQLATECGVPFRSTRQNYLVREWPEGEYVLGYANLPEEELMESIYRFAARLATSLQFAP